MVDNGGHTVWIFVDDHVKIKEGGDITVNLYASKHLKVEKADGDATFMNGIFIAEKIDAKENVFWSWQANACPTNPLELPLVTDPVFNDGAVTPVTMLSVYPNPASTSIRVRWSGDNPSGTVQLTDLMGRVLIEQELQKENQFNVFQLRSGNYAIRVKADGYKQQVERVVVDR